MWMRQQLALASHSTGVGVFASNARCPCILTHGAQAQGEAHGRPLGIVLLDLALTCYSLAPPRPPWPWGGRHRAHTAAQGFLFSLFSEYCILRDASRKSRQSKLQRFLFTRFSEY